MKRVVAFLSRVKYPRRSMRDQVHINEYMHDNVCICGVLCTLAEVLVIFSILFIFVKMGCSFSDSVCFSLPDPLGDFMFARGVFHDIPLLLRIWLLGLMMLFFGVTLSLRIGLKFYGAGKKISELSLSEIYRLNRAIMFIRLLIMNHAFIALFCFISFLFIRASIQYFRV